MPDSRCPVPTERWRTTEEQSYKDQTTTQRSSKKHTKTSTRSNKRGLYKETTGQEKHGSKWSVGQHFQVTYHHNQHFHQPMRQHQATFKQSTADQPQAPNVSTQREEASHRGKANRPSNDHNAAISNSNSTSKGSQSNTGLLDQRRSILENVCMSNQEGTCTFHNKQMMDRRDKTDHMETNNGEANKWQQRI